MTSQTAIGKALKALYAVVISALGMLSTVLVGNDHFGDITDGQWVNISLFAIVAGGGVFGLAGWSGPKINGGK